MRHIFYRHRDESVLLRTASILKATVFGVAVLLPSYGLASSTSDLDVLLNAEENLEQDFKPAASAGVSISVDGETIVGSFTRNDANRKTDIDLENVDIQVKFDGLGAQRQLAVSTVPERRIYPSNEPIEFFAIWNYPDWTTRAEVRVYDARASVQNPSYNEALHTLPLDPSGRTYWQPGEHYADGSQSLYYTVRVYDSEGRFDETEPLALKIGEVDSNTVLFADDDGADARGLIEKRPERESPGSASSNIAVSNIPLNGGVVTVYGKNVPDGVFVEVQGRNVPVASGNDFVTQRILPPGDHTVDINVYSGDGEHSIEFERDVLIPDNEWFYVAIADATYGKRFGRNSNLLAPVTAGEYDAEYKKGRLAFYLKGKVQGKYLITAALDTTEEDLDEIFSNLDKKDPRQLLRRLDPDDFYPVYGDDSTLAEDAPTSGRFYVRVDRGKSHVMWGNFKTKIDGVEFARYERGLYGANAVLKIETSTSFGEPVAEIKAFAAQPGTLPQRDVFKGTGGSAYFLKRQDINQGSEQITVEIRDQTTGLVIDRRTLKEGTDYTVDYVQGVLILRDPLTSTVPSGGAVIPTSGSDYDQFLIVNYEYTPTLLDVEGYSYGGRATTWIADRIQVGVTGFQETTGYADQTLIGADLKWRISEKSYFQLEWAQSEGDSFANVVSTDGGLIFTPVTGDGVGKPAEAQRARVKLDLGEMTGELIQGSIGAGYEEREAGFNGPGRHTSVDERILDAHATIEINEDTKFTAKFNQIERADGVENVTADAEFETRINDRLTAKVGAQHSDIGIAGSAKDGTGSRTDVGGRLIWHGHGDEQIYVFGQTTVDNDRTRERNDRVGVGFNADLSDKVSAEGEISHGTSGIALMAGLNYEPTAGDRYFVGYRMQNEAAGNDNSSYDPFGRDNGALVLGARKTLSETTVAFAEHNYDFMGTSQGLTHTYGVEYSPTESWKFIASMEAGHIRDENGSDFDRYAPSASVKFQEDGKSLYGKLEARFESSVDNTRDRVTWLAQANAGFRYDDNWRFLASMDLVLSDSDQSVVLDADYIEASAGFAYRPVDSDRFNALVKYTYLHDDPASQQANSDGVIGGPKQRSHIVSADVIYDVSKRLSVGAKYGMRIGEIATSSTNSEFVSSSAHLGVARFDYHVVKNWDILLEGRALWLSELEQVNYGALAGVYRHVGDNFKVGVGYNFGQFSDQVRDLTLDDEGFFVNVVGKF